LQASLVCGTFFLFLEGKMNKNELVAKVAEETRLTKADCQRVIEATLEAAKKSVKKGDEVRLIGFGTFIRARRNARKGRNPQTGETITIKSQWVARFRPGKDFRSYLN
jgi:DNA-binding protein HU-beta